MNDEARKRRLSAEENSRDLKRLHAAANMSSAPVERLDWMYEQTSTKTQEQIEDELMNTAVKSQKDEDVERMKQLQGGVAGSLFLQSATSATEDMMRKLREDPLFQIRQAEVRRKESILANPLLRERLLKKREQQQEKKAKKEKKKDKKEKKDKKDKKEEREERDRDDKKAERDRDDRREERHRATSSTSSFAHHSARTDTRRRHNGSISTEGRSVHGLSAEEKERRLKEMMEDGKSHEEFKDSREKKYSEKEKRLEELEKEMRDQKDRSVFKKMNQAAYMSGSVSMEDRIKSSRHRRQKGLVDPLERD